MLTPALTRARRRGKELQLPPLEGKKRIGAVALARAVLEVARANLGESQKTVRELLAAIVHEPSEKKLLDGLAKLVLDASESEGAGEIDSRAARRSLFEAACARRKELAPGVFLDRASVMEDVARELELTSEALDQALYADLPSEEKLAKVPDFDALSLVDHYERSERQAVLLRAVRIVADVTESSPHAYRALFGKLKFRRLLCRIERRGAGYRIEIDGPYSLFESVTKYGLALALVLPELEACERLDLSAELRWGARREALTYRYQKSQKSSGAAVPPLSDDVNLLLEAFRQMDTPWRAEPSSEILDLPGAGVCVPESGLSSGQGSPRLSRGDGVLEP